MAAVTADRSVVIVAGRSAVAVGRACSIRERCAWWFSA